MAVADEVHVFARLSARPGQEDRVRDVLRELVAAIVREPGVVHYRLHEDTEQAGSFFFFEVYADPAAFDAHQKSPALAKAFKIVGPLLAAPPVVNVTRQV